MADIVANLGAFARQFAAARHGILPAIPEKEASS
jgi:hypothetical protein